MQYELDEKRKEMLEKIFTYHAPKDDQPK